MDHQDKSREELIQEIQALRLENNSLKSSFEKDIAQYKEASKKNAESHDLLSNLAGLVPGVLYQYRLYPDGHSSFPYSSQGMNDIYEVTPEEVCNDASILKDRFHPEDFENVKKAITESASTLEIFYCEFRVILPIQGLRWRWSLAYPERMADGGTLWHGIVMDITERKNSEEQLQELVFELKRSQRIAHLGNWKLDLKTGTYSSSEEGLHIFGFPVGSYLKIQNVNDCIHPDDLELVSKRREELTQRKENYVLEFRIISKDTGQLKNVKTIGEVQCDANGTPVAIVGTIQDITEQVEARKQLKLLSRAIEHAPISVVITDKNANIEYVNPKFAALTGYTLEEVKGKNPRFLQSGKHRLDFYKELWDTLISCKEWKGEFYNRKKNGDLYIESAIICPILNNRGEPSHYVAVKEDITEKKRILEDLIMAKEKAVESDNLKTAFLNNISHEIRTPFNGMLGYISILQSDDLSPAEKNEYISVINNSSKRLMNTLNDIVEISQIQAGQMKFTPRNVDIKQVTQEKFNRYQSEAKDKGLDFRFKYDLPKEIRLISTDGLKLKTVISTLINNAIKFTQFGFVEFSVCKSGDFLKFTISDTGIGIPEDKKQTIFDRFTQADVSKTRLFEGLGLGLSISKAYVEMMGGEIWFESEVKKGSTFYFTIPFQQVNEESKIIENNALTKITGDGFNNLKILIVEDDESSMDLIKYSLKSISKELLTARNGMEAVDACRSNPDIDLVLMDLKLPLMDGYEATREIRKFNSNLIIIAQTAFAFAGDQEKALAAGCTDYLTKPMTKTVLLEYIQKYF